MTLFDDFEPISASAWRSLIEKDLKGASFDARMIWKTEEGFDVFPFYQESSETNMLQPVSNKLNDNHWIVRQDIDFVANAQVNQDALYVLRHGVQEIGICVKSKKNNDLAFEEITKDILLDAIGVHLVVPNFIQGMVLLEKWFQFEGHQEVKQFSFLSNPIQSVLFAETSNFDVPSKVISKLIEYCRENPTNKLIGIDGGIFQEQGATLSETLGFVLAVMNETVKLLQSEGISVQDTIQQMHLRMVTSGNYFFEIAKYRAVQLLWEQFTEAYACPSIPLPIHATNATWNKTILDVDTNLLRTTTETMAAIIGGVNSISVLPHDAIKNHPTKFSYRLAQNIQWVLKHESFFDYVIDPASGSYYVEHLTEGLALQAWKIFQEIEREGGMLNAKNRVIETLTTAKEAKKNAVAKRQKVFVGVNRYPLSQEKITLNEKDWRASLAIEKLRFETEEAVKVGHQRLSFLLLKFGNPAMATARALFVQDFLGCGGFTTEESIYFESLKKATEAHADTSHDFIVLCSTDENYIDINNYTFTKPLIIAGMPQSSEENHFAIHRRSPLLATLRQLQSDWFAAVNFETTNSYES